MRRGYTLIEIIITVAITGILSIGMFKAFEAITIRSEKAKVFSALSIDSQSAMDQTSLLLYDRIPASVKEKAIDGTWHPLDADDNGFLALEWWGIASESYQNSAYSGFVDMYNTDTNKSNLTLVTPQTSKTAIEGNQSAKWNTSAAAVWNNIALVFSQTFDEGGVAAYPITMNTGIDNKIVFTGTPPDTIYEKYNLVDSAYAIARGENIDQSAPCITALGKIEDMNNTLFLFYDYRPWKTGNKTFCADKDNPDLTGKATVLTTNINDFRASSQGGTVRLKMNMYRVIKAGNPVRLSKQKVVF
jgi:prepilin-type N-terminal cleavage/methylation domain-containing protein